MNYIKKGRGAICVAFQVIDFIKPAKYRIYELKHRTP